MRKRDMATETNFRRSFLNHLSSLPPIVAASLDVLASQTQI
jgi:hypothetical protein